jgi:uncharacterized protein YjiS (DUF1127 family)
LSQAWQSICSPLARGLDILRTLQQRYRMHSNLLGLNERLLRDIGISRTATEKEASKPFWQI